MAPRIKQMLGLILMVQIVLLVVYLAATDFSFVATISGYLYSNSSNTSLQDYINSSNTSLQDGASTKGSPPREPETFQPIDGKQAWLYSAFYDHVAAKNGKPLVRVFGVVSRAWKRNIFCNFSTENGSLSSTGAIIELPGSFNKRHFPTLLDCSVPSNVRPTYVSVSFGTTDKPTNRLKIIYPGPRIRNFTVCYSVLFGGYNKTTQLIESIEVNRILGAEHFMVYNYSISPEVSQILSRYQEDGLVTVLQWPIPTLDSWYFAQITALNDCSYRNRNTSRFVVVVDTDELIVPRSHYTWMELIHNVSPTEIDVSQFMNSSELSNKRQTQTGCFMVRSSFFCVNATPSWDLFQSQFLLGNEDKKNIIKYKLLSLSQVFRNSEIFRHYIRSKYISRPELVYITGIHEVFNFITSMSFIKVSDTTALVHHYREPCPKTTGINDTSVLKFQQTIYTHVMKQIQRFPNLFP